MCVKWLKARQERKYFYSATTTSKFYKSVLYSSRFRLIKEQITLSSGKRQVLHVTASIANFLVIKIIERKRNTTTPTSHMIPSQQCSGWREPQPKAEKEPYTKLHKIIYFFKINIIYLQRFLAKILSPLNNLVQQKLCTQFC